jgi:hypothetical protein
MSSGTSEPLVPQGLPYGERQAQVARMQQAGLPLSPRQGNASALSPAQTGAQPAVPSDGAGLPAPFDPLTELQPMQPWNSQPADPKARFRQIADTTTNSFVRELLYRTMDL